MKAIDRAIKVADGVSYRNAGEFLDKNCSSFFKELVLTYAKNDKSRNSIIAKLLKDVKEKSKLYVFEGEMGKNEQKAVERSIDFALKNYTLK